MIVFSVFRGRLYRLCASSAMMKDFKGEFRVLRESMKKLLGLKWDSNPSETANEVHKVVRRLTKVRDPPQ